MELEGGREGLVITMGSIGPGGVSTLTTVYNRVVWVK